MMKYACGTVLILALPSVLEAFAPTAEADETRVQEPANYARPFEPPTRPAFLRPRWNPPAGCATGAWPRGMVTPATWTSMMTSSSGPGPPTTR